MREVHSEQSIAHAFYSSSICQQTSLCEIDSARDVIVLDKNYREVIRHLQLYSDREQESMDRSPCLTQLTRRSIALKNTVFYPMLPDEVQEFLARAVTRSRKRSQEVLARLSKENSFSKAVEAVRAAVSHGPSDVDSVLAIFNRLNSNITDLDPLVLPADVPEIPPVKLDLNNHDNDSLKVLMAKLKWA